MKRFLWGLLLPLIFLSSTLKTLGCNVIVVTATVINENNCGIGPNGSIDIDIIGGDAPYTYAWTNGDTIEDISELSAGTYGVTVYDSNGCDGVAAFVVGLAPSMTLSDLSIYPSCDGDLGTGLVSVTGGNPPYTYNWTNGSEDSVANNLAIGIHSVIVTDASGCVDSLEIDIITNPELQVFPIVEHSVCYADSGSVSLLIIGGASPYIINWNGIDSTRVVPGTYSVSVTDLSGCEKEVDYTVLSEDEINIDITPVITSCDDNLYTLEVNVDGGVPPYTYLWSVVDTSQVTAGIHTLEITDSLGCIKEATFEIDTAEMLEVSFEYSTIDCIDTITDVTLTIVGGVSPYHIAWSDGQLNLFTKSVVLGDDEFVTITDDRGCEFVQYFDVSGPGKIHLSPEINHTTCGNNNGGFIFNATGGSGEYSYFVNGNNVGTSVGSLPADSYTIQIKDDQGCTLDTVIVVNEIPVAKLLDYTIEHNVCSSDTAGQITVKFDNQDITYSWSNNETTSSISDLVGGNYTLTVTDTIGCTWDTTFVVDPGTKILASFTDLFEPCSVLSDDATLTVHPTGGIEPYTYVWGDGSEDQELIVENIGEYEVTITDSVGCSNTFSFAVEGDPIGGNSCFKIPNAFSPNGDNFNDTWKILGIEQFPLAHVQIFDRWGKLIIDKKNYESDWDGTIDGNELEMGSYMYIVNLNSPKASVFKGIVSIKR